MLESVFLALFGFAIFMTILTAWDRDEIIWPIMGFIVWIALAISTTSIELPYAFLAPDNTVVTHITSYGNAAPLAFLFIGMAFVFVIIAWSRVSAMYRKVG